MIADRGKRAEDEGDTHLRHCPESGAKVFGDLRLSPNERAEILH